MYTQRRIPASTASSGGGTIVWSNPGNVTAADNTYCTAVGVVGQSTQYLILKDFGFDIPTNATISGVIVRVEAKGSSGSASSDYNLWLTKNGSSTTGVDKTLSFNATETLSSYGGTNDLWSATLTPSDVGSTNFGVIIELTNVQNTITFSIDYVDVQIFFNQSVAGPRTSGTNASDSTYGTTAWTNPGNVTTQDSNYATCTPASLGESQMLKITNLGFSIPTGSIVNGIQLRVRKSRTGGTTGNITDKYVYVYSPTNAAYVSGVNKASASVWGTSFADSYYGSATDTWGCQPLLTAEEVNNTNFGFGISCQQSSGGNRQARIDYMTVTIYYTSLSGFKYIVTSHVNGSYDAATKTNTITNITLPANTTSLVVVAHMEQYIAQKTISSATFDGNAMTKAASQVADTVTNVWNNTEIWYLNGSNLETTNKTLNVVWNADHENYAIIDVYALGGYKTSSPIGNTSTTESTAYSTSLTGAAGSFGICYVDSYLAVGAPNNNSYEIYNNGSYGGLVYWDYGTTGATKTLGYDGSPGGGDSVAVVAVEFLKATPQITFTSTINAASTVTASTGVRKSLTSTIAAQSGVSASTKTILGLISTIAASSNVNADIGRIIHYASTIASTSGVSAAINYLTSYVSTISGSSSVIADANVIANYNSIITGSSTLTANLNTISALNAIINGLSSVNANLNCIESLESIIEGQSSVLASMNVYRGLEAVINAISALSANIDLNKTYVLFECMIAAQSGVTANITPERLLSSTIAGSSGVMTSINATRSLLSTITGSSFVSADVNVIASFVSVISGLSSVVSDLNTILGLASTINGASGINCDLSKLASLESAISAISSVSSVLGVYRGFESTINGVGTVSADMNSILSLMSDINAMSSLITAVNTIAGYSAEIDGLSSVSADVNIITSLESLIAASSNVSSTLNTIASLEALIPGISSLIASMSQPVSLVCTIAAQSGVSVDMNAIVGLMTAINASSSLTTSMNVLRGLESVIHGASSVNCIMSRLIGFSSIISATSGMTISLSKIAKYNTIVVECSDPGFVEFEPFKLKKTSNIERHAIKLRDNEVFIGKIDNEVYTKIIDSADYTKTIDNDTFRKPE